MCSLDDEVLSPNGPRLSSYTHFDDIICEGWIDSLFTYIQKGRLIISQGYIRVIAQHLYIRLID